MQRASSETIVLDAERSFEPAISRPQLSALPAELWHPLMAGLSVGRLVVFFVGCSFCHNLQNMRKVTLPTLLLVYLFNKQKTVYSLR